MKAKRRSCAKLFLLLSGLLLGSGALAAEGEQPAQRTELAAAPGAAAAEPAPVLLGLDEKISLDLRSTEVTDALKFLAMKGGLNMAVSKTVSGRVNLFLTDVPIRDVFDIVLLSNELAYDKRGDVYNIMTEAEYRALYGRRFADTRQVETFRLQYAIPEQAFNLLDTLKSEIGRILVDDNSGTVLVIDTPERLVQMREALATLERGSAVKVFDLKYAKAKEVEERLKDELEAKKLGVIKSDERSNQVLVRALPGRLAEVEQLIAALDRPTREVLIDAKIIKVTLDDKAEEGVDWESVFTKTLFHGLDPASHDFRRSTTGTAPSETVAVKRLTVPFLAGIKGNPIPSQKLVFTTIDRTGYKLFEYLKTLGKTKIISNPRLMVTENQEARIHVGTREAYVTTTTTTGQTTSTTAEEVQFIDVGIQLLVTPTINADGYVTMKIKPEVSNVTSTLTTPTNNKIPIVDTSTAETRVMVKSGSTVIIGGLRKDEKKVTDKKLPFLGDIPVLGRVLFNNRSQANQIQEMVVLITPHIMAGETLVTGDELEIGGKFQPFHDYPPLADGEAPAAPETPEVPEAAETAP